jgi:hypothetical protein
MLQGWISDSEKTVPTPVAPPSQSTTTTAAITTPSISKSAGSSRNFLIYTVPVLTKKIHRIT